MAKVEEENKKEDIEKMIKVYSISFMIRDLKKNIHNWSFVLSKDLIEIKQCFDYASAIMVPGDDIIKITLNEMSEKKFADIRALLAEEQQQINMRGR